MRWALFGGSFNPPHVAHQMAMLYALATARVDRLLMVPCWRHPFDKRLVAYEHRFAMARLAAGPLGAGVEVSDIEARIGGDSRTLLTVKALSDEHPGVRIALVVGADLLEERERWYGWSELRTLVDFVVVGRAGRGGGASGEARPIVELPDISSTEIRARVARGASIEGLVPAAVLDYIEAHGLYRDRDGA